MSTTIIRVHGLGDGTEFSRPLWIESYDIDASPARQSIFNSDGAIVNGLWGGATRLTIHRDRAKRFPSFIDASAAWNTVSKRCPLRPDGRPNKPLTAFTVEFENA